VKRLIFLPLIFLLTGLACALPNVTVNWPTETPPAVPPSTSPSPAPVLPTPVPPTVQPTPGQPEVVPSPAPGGVFLPIGLAVVPLDRTVVQVFGPDGQLLGEMSVPGLESADMEKVHLAGGWSAGRPPVAYFTFNNGGQILVNTNEQITVLVNTPNFAGMLGAPGQPFLAYSLAELGPNGLSGRLYAAPIASLAGAAPIISFNDPDGRAVKPLAIRVENGAPTGVWYARRPWGIGGDIVFDPTDGIYYVSLSDGAVTEKMGADARSASLSPDQAWASYASGEPGNGALHVHNLLNGADFRFDLLPASDRGAGYGVFSPASTKIAWMEGSGSGMADVPNFHATVRVGTTQGAWLADYPDTMIANLLGSPVAWVQPVGWLDENRLVLQVRGANWDDSSLVIVDVATNLPTRLAAGTFVEFVYP